MREAGRSRLKMLSARDKADWDAVARLIKPLPGKRIDPAAPVAPVQPVAAVDAVAARAFASLSKPPPSPLRARPVALDVRPAGLDSGSWRRFTEGRIRPQARLDLHGCTVNQACEKLVRFLHSAHMAGLRCVEVITGLGSGAGGVIRHELPFWLTRDDCAPLLLAVSYSSPRNHGAVRILLRRVR